MVPDNCRLGLAVLTLAATFFPVVAQAQVKSAENAVESSEDAFGTSVGLEATGIYSQYNVRGFNPTDAGNARLDGIYYDPVALISLRAKTSQAIRVGYAALEYPFPAPTGIVDTLLRTADDEFHAGVEAHLQQYGSYVLILDTRIPLAGDRLALVAGVSHGRAKFVDGAGEKNYSFALKPVVRLGGVEISPFYSVNYVRQSLPRPLVVLGGDFIPDVPASKRYYGPKWAQGSKDNVNFGATVKARITGRLSLRAGLFKSQVLRKANFTDIYLVKDPNGLSDHIFIADPQQDVHSWSGEVQFGYRLEQGRWRHRLIAGFRRRDRHTEFGGSDYHFGFGTAMLGVPDPEAASEPDFDFQPVNLGKVRQTAFTAGYVGRLEGVGLVNLGLQRASFRARTATQADTTATRAKHWLYNASLGINITADLIAYAGTQKGLEDNGVAPQIATNRDEQLPAGLSRQYEAGLRWKIGKQVLLLSVFEIAKPYYSIDGADFYTRLGTVRHTGIEASLSGHFIGGRLNVLAGVAVMDPVVSGPGRDAGIVGRMPVGTRGTRGRVDLTYRTDLWDGFTPTLAVEYRGSTAAASDPIDSDGRQLELGSHLSIDIGFRQPLKIGRVPASLRVRLEDLLDQRRWLVPSSRTLFAADRRRFSAGLLVDF